MTLNLDALRKTAEAATPGPWDLYSTQDYEVFCAANFTDSNYDPPAVTYGSDRSDDAEFIATFDPPTVLTLLSRLEQAEGRVKLLESGIVSELATTSLNAAQTIGIEVSWISEAILKMGYSGLTERLEQAEQAVQRVREALSEVQTRGEKIRAKGNNGSTYQQERAARGEGYLEATRLAFRALDGDGRG